MKIDSSPVKAIRIALAIVAIIAIVGLATTSPWAWLQRIAPVSYGFAAALLLYFVTFAITGRGNPLHLAMGADKKLSVSQFQFLLWTAVVVFAYAWLTAARIQRNNFEPVAIPQNLMIAMGLSIATLAGAKGITVGYLRSGVITKPPAAEGETTASALVTSDSQTPDLTKIQMLVWTIIGTLVFVVHVHNGVDAYATCTSATCSFPDIDGPLMVLMGLGQSAYIGNKLTSMNTTDDSKTDGRIDPLHPPPPDPPG